MLMPHFLQEEEVALKAQKQSADHRAADATPVETSKDDSDHSTADKSSMLKPKAAMPTSTVKVNTRQQHSLPTEEDDEQLRMVRHLVILNHPCVCTTHLQAKDKRCCTGCGLVSQPC